jgi:hypothetical protein
MNIIVRRLESSNANNSPVLLDFEDENSDVNFVDGAVDHGALGTFEYSR